MKICFITMNLYSYGGIQRVLSQVLSNLNSREGFKVDIVMPVVNGSENVFGLDESIRIIDYYNFKMNDATIMGFLCRIFRRVNRETGIFDNTLGQEICNIVYFPGNERNSIIDFLMNENYDLVVGVGDLFALLLSTICPQLSCKAIGWMHSTFESYFLEKGDQCYGLYRYAKKKYKNLRYVMALTNRDVNKFENEFNIKALRLQNPVNYYCEEPNCNFNGPLIFVGRMIKSHKGLDYLAQIIDKYHKIDPEKEYIILGDGPDKKWFEDEIKQKGLSDYVAMPGLVSNVEDYLEKSSLFIHTSRWEGFGVVILEAMMYGLPVVAFHNNGPDEIIEHGIDGYLIDRFDCDDFCEKIKMILDNRRKYESMSNNANKKAKGFTPERITDDLISIIQNN